MGQFIILITLGFINFLVTGYFFSDVMWLWQLGLWIILMIASFKLVKNNPIIGILFTLLTSCLWFCLTWILSNLIEVTLIRWLIRILSLSLIGKSLFTFGYPLCKNITLPNLSTYKSSTKRTQKTINEYSQIFSNLSEIIICERITIDNFFVASKDSDIILNVLQNGDVKYNSTNKENSLYQVYDITILSQNKQILDHITSSTFSTINEFENKLREIENKYYLKSCKKFDSFNEAASYSANTISEEKIRVAIDNYHSEKNQFEHLCNLTPKTLSSSMIAEKGLSLIAAIEFELKSKYTCICSYLKILKNTTELHSINKELRNLYETSNFGNKQQSVPPTESKSSNDTITSLFNGCTNKESVTKRYRQLMKIYHTDNPNGDKEMSQQIQNVYQNILKNFT